MRGEWGWEEQDKLHDHEATYPSASVGSDPDIGSLAAPLCHADPRRHASVGGRTFEGRSFEKGKLSARGPRESKLHAREGARGIKTEIWGPCDGDHDSRVATAVTLDFSTRPAARGGGAEGLHGVRLLHI